MVVGKEFRRELKENKTGPWGSKINFDTLHREHHEQDSPARGPTGRLGMLLDIVRKVLFGWQGCLP